MNSGRFKFTPLCGVVLVDKGEGGGKCGVRSARAFLIVCFFTQELSNSPEVHLIRDSVIYILYPNDDEWYLWVIY